MMTPFIRQLKQTDFWLTFKFTVNINPDKNITSIKLTKLNVLSDRMSNDPQLATQKNIQWTIEQ